MNSLSILGRICKDLELKETKGGMKYLKFSLAVNKRVKQGEDKKADFFNVTAWGKTAEFIEKYMGKGMQVAIQGRIEKDADYTNKEGQKVYGGVSIIAENVYFADGKKEPGATNKSSGVEFEDINSDTDELPF